MASIASLFARIIKVTFKKSNNDDDWVFQYSHLEPQITASNLGTNHVTYGDYVIKYGKQDVRGFSFEEFDNVVNPKPETDRASRRPSREK